MEFQTRLKRVSISAAIAVVCGASALAGDLADALESRSFERAKQLLAERVDVNLPQVDGMTALHWAVYHDKAEWVQKLLSRGANPKAENRYGIAPLYLACVNGNAEVVTALLESGADPNAEIRGGESALMTASRTGDIDTVTVLIEAGAEVDRVERKGQTALMWAAAEGRIDVVDALLAAGADPEITLRNSGYTAFFFALREGHRDLVHYFLDRGVDVNRPMDAQRPMGKQPKKGTTPLILAIENGHYDLAVELLDRGADPNDESSGFTALHSLTWIRKPDIGESASGDPPPRGSGLRNSVQFTRELVARGADVNLRLQKNGKAGTGRTNTRGATAFLLAADRADLEFMKLLVELGADPHIPNKTGTTPLMVAAGVGSSAPEEEAGSEEECLAAVKYLVSLGGDINTVDANGETAMHGAALKNIPSVVAYLDTLDADIELWNRPNKDGWTPLLIAEGYRPGNFKPSFATVDAIVEVMNARGVPLPTGPKPKHTNYAD